MTSALPMKPEAPAMTSFTAHSPSIAQAVHTGSGRVTRRPGATVSAQSERAFEGAGLQPGLHGGEEPSGVGPVDYPVVIGQRQIHHRTDRDDLAELRIRDH